MIRDYVKQFNYEVNDLRLNEFLGELNPNTLDVKLVQTPEFDWISSRMDAGNNVRKKTDRGDLLASTLCEHTAG